MCQIDIIRQSKYPRELINIAIASITAHLTFLKEKNRKIRTINAWKNNDIIFK